MADRRGEVVVKVERFEAARERILQALALQGAELIEAKTLVNEKGRKHGWITVRLASDRLPDALPVVRSAGKLSAEDIQTSDYSSDYESLARRAERLKEHQIRLAGILSSERRLRGSDVLYVQERLFRASVDEGLLLQQRQDIASKSRFCVLTIRLFEPMPTRTMDRVRLDVAGHFASAKARALDIVDKKRAQAVTASAYALVFAPIWVPLLIDPLWLHREEIARRAKSISVVLYAQLPDRLRQPITSVRAAMKPASSQTPTQE
jgi:hypothetical protein